MPRSRNSLSPPSAIAPMQRGDGLDFGILDSLLGYSLRRAQNALYLHFSEASVDPELTPQRFAAMVLIERNPGINQSSLGEAMGINRSGAMRLVDWFEARGLATRVTHDNDARRWGLQLTLTGTKTVGSMAIAISAHDRRLIELLGVEGDTLKRLLDRLAEVAQRDLRHRAADESAE